MKYFWLGLILILCAVAYLHSEQPKIWNDCLAALKSPEDASSASPANAPPVAAAPPAIPAPTNAPPAPPVTKVDVATRPITAPLPRSEVISPDSTNFINPDHIKQVEQPGEASTNSPKVFIPPDPLPAQPNWIWTVEGREYHNVVITKVEADCVSITYDLGTGRIDSSLLPPDIQKLLNYDPQAAAQARHQKAAALAQAEAVEAPKIAALKQQQANQANADDAQRKLGIQNEASSGNVGVAQDQKRQLQSDVNEMVSAHEITIYNDPQTGVHVNGTTYWLDRYYADEQAIAKWDKVINSGGK